MVFCFSAARVTIKLESSINVFVAFVRKTMVTMMIKALKYAVFLFVAILLGPQVAMAEWYIKPSVGVSFGGPFGGNEIEIDDEFVNGSPVNFQGVNLGAEDTMNLKLGYWFTKSSFTRKFPKLNLGLEMELEKYSFHSNVSFTQKYYLSPPPCTGYRQIYDWWTNSYWNVCVEWAPPTEYDATYSVSGDEMRIGFNFLIRKIYQESDLYPTGRAHVYGGIGIGFVTSDIDVISNGVGFKVADGDTSTNEVLLIGVDYMFTPNVGVFFEINFSAVPHDYPVPGLGIPDNNTTTFDSGSVYLMGISYHFF